METRDVTTRVPYQPRPGAPFAGHTLGDLIGWGGFASVYRLLDTPPGAETARCIKIGYRPDPKESQGYAAGGWSGSPELASSVVFPRNRSAQ